MRIDFTHPAHDAIPRHPVFARSGATAAGTPESRAAEDSSVPPVPPAEILEETRSAARRAARLAGTDRELHFRMDEETSRIIVEVRDLRGTVIRTIPPSSALDLMTGGRSWQAWARQHGAGGDGAIGYVPLG